MILSLIIASATLNPTPVPSEPCTQVPLPNGGTMCAPKVVQKPQAPSGCIVVTIMQDGKVVGYEIVCEPPRNKIN